MARGWGSKSVEAQIDSAQNHGHMSSPGQDERSAAELDCIRRKEGLLLSRIRVAHDLETAQNPRYKAMLAKALEDLDSKLKQIH